MNTAALEIIRIDQDTLARHLDDLCRVSIDTVAEGAAIGFIAPLDPAEAERFWSRDVKAAIGSGARLLFGALMDGKIVGTVQLVVGMPPNQSHRAEISKMIVHPDYRQRGIGKRLLLRAFDAARRAGKTLVTLDTRTGDVSEWLYQAVGFERAGIIPDFALDPDGRALHATTYMYRRL
ncbi:GNAT family N-acetyltransferase [Jannaschia seohaensis]|uniref:Ribosomal protein S18 acetylase RimI n=1 Tax=Jannaschia seohaensis TaxID=475081 RepID=A0A2Y8ZWC4_9RHOB|nr:GNAT family N-acetyltransferase [Jannaschia seohaensis]PWJ21598.1 ribosomal protein S18 acetylase RimI-like enzyme [Jannaschia seohaensis]SSA36630.1 Ribosomal protein S18 acetylase RimI [Jannaschia seohaensis]